MLELDKAVVRIPAGAINFSFIQKVEPDSEAKPASYSMGTGGTVPEVKGLGSEV
jgi:hypothetical protein